MSLRYVNQTVALSDVELGVMISINILFSFTGTVGNLAVCFAFILCRNLRNTMNIFIFSLACSDLLVCLVAQPMFITRLFRNPQADHVTTISEDIRSRLTWISLLASIGNLLGVTMDRYFIIADPLRYAARVTTNTACVFVAVVWTFATTLGALTLYNRNARYIGQIYVVVLLAGMIIPLYCRILCIARRHARLIHSFYNRVQTSHSDKTNTLAPRTRRPSVQKADRNSLKTVGIISSIFVIGWFPLLILPFIYRAEGNDKSAILNAFQWANTLALCSSACNPIVYSWRDRRFRKVLTVNYEKWKARRSVSGPFTTGMNSEKVEMKTCVRTVTQPT
ncbi:adrenocorticotropic hormone receptor-like [Dendronephthya gigantea]|uniref:adrenocorticotropic hormone receptor-like n=1 Tax=Dendronephthya gigantea TaxID=151771 RepID=UPI001069D031|nr:adrenocorticotropic hormone receptor-like [Dendronephthya gigantea]